MKLHFPSSVYRRLTFFLLHTSTVDQAIHPQLRGTKKKKCLAIALTAWARLRAPDDVSRVRSCTQPSRPSCHIVVKGVGCIVSTFDQHHVAYVGLMYNLSVYRRYTQNPLPACKVIYTHLDGAVHKRSLSFCLWLLFVLRVHRIIFFKLAANSMFYVRYKKKSSKKQPM